VLVYLVNLFASYCKIITGIPQQVSFHEQLPHKISLWCVCDSSIPDECSSC